MVWRSAWCPLDAKSRAETGMCLCRGLSEKKAGFPLAVSSHHRAQKSRGHDRAAPLRNPAA